MTKLSIDTLKTVNGGLGLGLGVGIGVKVGVSTRKSGKHC